MPSRYARLVTVRHSGSHFAAEVLRLPNDGYWHAESIQLGEIYAANPAPLILTMRHPLRVVDSWIKRGREIDRAFIATWHHLFALKQAFQDSYWLPMDTPCRESRLAAIGERLERHFETTWQPIGGTTRYDTKRQGMDDAQTRAFLRRFPFGEFGYDV